MNKAILTLWLIFSPFIVHSQWNQVNGPKNAFSGIDLIVNDSVFILSTSGASVYSVDTGGHWKPFIPEVFYQSAIFHNNLYTGGEYYPGYGQARLRKHTFTDGSWEHQIVYTNDVLVKGLAADDHCLYAAFQRNTPSPGDAGFVYSTDGETWSMQNTGLPIDTIYGYSTYYVCNLYSLGVNDQFVFAGAKNGVYRSDKTNFQWFRTSEGLPANGRVDAIVCHENLLIIAIGNRFFKSSDNGQTWVFNFELSGGNTVNRLQCIGETFFALTETQGLLVSDDMGATWLPANIGLDNMNAQCIIKNGTTFYLGHGTGISKGLNKWENINHDIVVSNVRNMAQTTAALAAVEFDKVFISTDEGLIWENRTPFEDLNEYIYSIVNVNGCFLFSVKREFVSECLNYRSCDNGETWSLVAPLYSDDGVYKLRSNGSRVVAFANSTMFLSGNAGDSWSEITPPAGLKGNFSDVLFTGNDLYAALEYSDKVIHSDDFGQTWHLCNGGLGGEKITTFGEAPGMIFATGINKMFRSTDRGETWVECAPLGEDVREVISDGGLVFACKNREVYFSRNFGGSWTDISKGLPPLPDLWGGTLMVRGDQLCFGTYTYGIYQRSIANLPNSVNEVHTGGRFGLFPNPATHFLTIQPYHQQVIVKVEIIDLSARVIEIPEITGNRICLSELAPAIYILRILTADNMVSHEIFVKRP